MKQISITPLAVAAMKEDADTAANVIPMTTPLGDRITTPSRIVADLQASLLRHVQYPGVYAGDTWGDFKKAIEALGIKDDDTIASIEYGVQQYPTGRLMVERDEHGAMDIHEMPAGSLK